MGRRRFPLTLLALALASLGCRTTTSRLESPGFRVRPAVAFEMLSDAPAMPVLDLRTPEEFVGALGHLARAKNVPLEELEGEVPHLDYLKDLTFLIYCRGWDDCGEQAMRVLLSHGFVDVVLMEGGLEAWLRDGFGTVGGDGRPMPLPGDPGLRIPTKVPGRSPRTHVPDPP
jgi:rhodanese-related sulfurtransferase